MTTTRELCIADHDDRPRTAAPGLRLCPGCRTRLHDDIAELPALYLDCELALASSGPGGTSDPVTFRRDPGLVLSIPAMQAREHIRVELSSWVRIGLDEGPWDQAPDDSVDRMAAWLRLRVDWYAARDWADEIARTIRDTTAEAFAAAYPTGASRIDLAPCVEAECTGTLFAYVRTDDDLLPAYIRCDADPVDHLWTPDEWRALERRISGRGYGDVRRALAG